MPKVRHVGFVLVKYIYITCRGYRPTREFFYSYEDVTIADEGQQTLTYPRHSWLLSIEGSLACHAYCDTDPPFIMVISEDP